MLGPTWGPSFDYELICFAIIPELKEMCDVRLASTGQRNRATSHDSSVGGLYHLHRFVSSNVAAGLTLGETQ
jgi:hypothetical protein